MILYKKLDRHILNILDTVSDPLERDEIRNAEKRHMDNIQCRCRQPNLPDPDTLKDRHLFNWASLNL